MSLIRKKLRKNYIQVFYSLRFLASFSYSIVFPSILKPSRHKLSVPALFIVISEGILSRLKGIVACKWSNRRYDLSSVDIAYFARSKAQRVSVFFSCYTTKPRATIFHINQCFTSVIYFFPACCGSNQLDIVIKT